MSPSFGLEHTTELDKVHFVMRRNRLSFVFTDAMPLTRCGYPTRWFSALRGIAIPKPLALKKVVKRANECNNTAISVWTAVALSSKKCISCLSLPAVLIPCCSILFLLQAPASSVAASEGIEKRGDVMVAAFFGYITSLPDLVLFSLFRARFPTLLVLRIHRGL